MAQGQISQPSIAHLGHTRQLASWANKLGKQDLHASWGRRLSNKPAQRSCNKKLGRQGWCSKLGKPKLSQHCRHTGCGTIWTHKLGKQTGERSLAEKHWADVDKAPGKTNWPHHLAKHTASLGTPPHATVASSMRIVAAALYSVAFSLFTMARCQDHNGSCSGQRGKSSGDNDRCSWYTGKCSLCCRKVLCAIWQLLCVLSQVLWAQRQEPWGQWRLLFAQQHAL